MTARHNGLSTISRRNAALATIAAASTNTCIVAAQAILLIPLYLHAVGPRVFGAWLASGDLLVWLQVFDLGLPNVLIQRIGEAACKNDQKSCGRLFATGLFALSLLSVAAFAGALA